MILALLLSSLENPSLWLVGDPATDHGALSAGSGLAVHGSWAPGPKWMYHRIYPSTSLFAALELTTATKTISEKGDAKCSVFRDF